MEMMKNRGEFSPPSLYCIFIPDFFQESSISQEENPVKEKDLWVVQSN
jgi:hypothetical protein